MVESAGKVSIPVSVPPERATRRPALRLPPRSCDCHAHVCGPEEKYPLLPDRIYTPAPVTVDDYRDLLAALGVERGVLVQPSFYGADNSALLEALAAAPSMFRGVAVVSDSVSDQELERLHAAGVRGLRFNIVDLSSGKGQLPIDRIRRLADRIKPFGWHVEMLMHVNEFPDLDREFDGFPVDVVFGHLGYVPTERGTGDAGFQALLRLLGSGRAWVKLTAPYRISPQAMPHPDVVPFAHALLEAAPERLVWGSDWPHVKAQWSIPMPNDGDIVDLLSDWVPSEAARHRILVENPVRLYGFDD